MNEKKLHVALLLGGASAEREVSKHSSQSIYNSLLELGYAVTLIDPAYGLKQPERAEDFFSEKDLFPVSARNYLEAVNSSLFDTIDIGGGFPYVTNSPINIKDFCEPINEELQWFTDQNGSEQELLDDVAKVEIINNESETICFSSCYPYVMQAKHNSWDLYSYPQCEEDNIAETCIPPNQLKAFAISLNGMFLEPTMHRLAIPACVGCAVGEQFRVDKIIYSNEFEIK